MIRVVLPPVVNKATAVRAFLCSKAIKRSRARRAIFWSLGLSTALFCTLAISADTGDAPASYGQASHDVVDLGPYLGNDGPDNNEPQFTNDALGDDNDGLDDEGGVFGFPVMVQNGKAYDVNVFASNPGTVDATVAAWVDFDGSGQFEFDEYASAIVSAGTVNNKFKLKWPELSLVSSDFTGLTYARFRISTNAIAASDSFGSLADGEVEDYTLEILLDTDGDERPDITDLDNDNDGIPDAVESTTAETDGDGIADYLDIDSDGDTIPDYLEAGANPLQPLDSDDDGVPDYLDLDSNNDGIFDSEPVSGDVDRDGIPDALEGSVDSDSDGVIDRQDLDSDNDTIPDAIERGSAQQGPPVDTDEDGIPDYLDLDSDNDSIPDIREANSGELNVNLLDTDFDGRVDSQSLTGSNGLANAVERGIDSGVPAFFIADTNADGVRDFRSSDSDADGTSDLLEAGSMDADGDHRVDSDQDLNEDGIADGFNSVLNAESLPDVDDDGVPDFQDSDANGASGSNGSGAPGGVIETGLSGGAGCAVAAGWEGSTNSGGKTTQDVVFGLMVLLSIAFLWRRKLWRCE